MQGWWKLLIPLGLGVLAAGLNYMGRSSDVEPAYYLGLNKDLKAGEEIKPGYLETIILPKTHVASLNKVGIPNRERAVVFGRRVQRSMKKGDLILWSDITAPAKPWEKDEVLLHLTLDNVSLPEDIRVGQKIGFILPKDLIDTSPDKEPKTKPVDPADLKNYKPVGPFRVHSVGNRIMEEDTPRLNSAQVQEITLIVPAPKAGTVFDENTHRLLTTVFGAAGVRRGAILIYPPEPVETKVEAPAP